MVLRSFHAALPTPNTGGPARRSLSRHGQADLAAKSRKARIALIALDEGVVEEVHDARIAVLQALPRVGEGLVFTMTGKTPVSGFSRVKAG